MIFNNLLKETIEKYNYKKPIIDISGSTPNNWLETYLMSNVFMSRLIDWSRRDRLWKIYHIGINI